MGVTKSDMTERLSTFTSMYSVVEHICSVPKEYSIIVLNNASLASIILEFVIGELRAQFLSPSYLLSPCALPCDFRILFRDQNAFLYPLWPALAKAQDRSGGRPILSEASGGLTYFGLCLHHGNKPGLLWERKRSMWRRGSYPRTPVPGNIRLKGVLCNCFPKPERL